MNLIIVTVGLIALPLVATAQAAARCSDSRTYFEFQVARPARWTRDSSFAVHPTAATLEPANLVEFVVDTTGIPDPLTFRALKMTDSAMVAAARQTFVRWWYSAAQLNGCPVRQLVQTPIGR